MYNLEQNQNKVTDRRAIMRKVRHRIFIMLMLLIVGFFIGLWIKQDRIKEDNVKVGLIINKWDNIYTERNIKLYYDNSNKQELDELNKKYNLDKIVSASVDEFDKSLKILNWINDNMKYKRNMKANVTAKGAFDILEGKNKKQTYSDEEISIVFNEFALAVGVISRIGQLTVSNEEKNMEDSTISICEIWSDKYNKWIMIDPANGCYILEKDVPMNAIEVIIKGLDTLKVEGKSNESKYKKYINKYFHAYTIKIDNGVYGISKSNSYITYLKDISINNLDLNLDLNQPTIFVDNSYMFNLSPKEKYVVEKSNEKATIIFMNKNQQTQEKDESVKIELIAGVFKNSSMVNNYYISINNGPFKEENQYFTIQIKSGINNIRLSEDGKTVTREIVLEYIDAK